MTVQEDVDTFTNGVGQGNDTIDGRSSVENADVIRKVVEDRQIVLDDNDIIIVTKQGANDGRGTQPLLDIEIGRGLIEHVDICLLDAHSADGESLQFTTREEVDVSVHDMVQFQNISNLLHISEGGPARDQMADALLGSTNSLGDLIHVLGLNDGLEIILEELGEVVCRGWLAHVVISTSGLNSSSGLTLQLRTTEVLDDFLPVRRIVMAAEIGLELSAENLQCSTLANTVGSNQSENLSRSGHRETMQLEAVGAIAMGDLAFQIGRQVDDGNGIEWAFLGADTTANAERLGDESEAGFGGDFNAELPAANNRAGLLALLATFPRAALFSRGTVKTMFLHFLSLTRSWWGY